MFQIRLLLLAFALCGSHAVVFGQSLHCFAREGTLNDQIGGSVTGGATAIDGDTAICGDPSHGDRGAVSIYRRMGTTWIQEAFIDAPPGAKFDEQFGHSVDISGDVAVVGAWQGDWNSYGPRGCAYVFTRSGSTWSFSKQLTNPSLSEFSWMGVDVAVSGSTIAVGADWPNLVMIFVWSGTDWIQQAVIQGPNGGYFGGSLDIEEGSPLSTLLVGAPRADLGGFDNSGAAYVYVGNGGSWTLQNTLNGAPLAPNRLLGGDVSLSGDTALIGAALASNGTVRSGAAFVYTRHAQSWQFEQKLIPPNGQFEDYFGFSLSLDGHQAVIGASGEDVISNNHGNAYFLYRVGATWSAPEPVLPLGALASYSNFGRRVAISGDSILASTVINTDVFVPKTRVGTAYCHCASAPCGNSDPQAGCANSTGQGAELSAQGSAALDDVDLVVSGAIPGVFGIFFEGDTSIQVPFGDGHLCTSGSLIRLVPLPTQVSANGTAMFGPCIDGPSIPSVTGVVPGSGDVKRYQFWYRDPSGPCGGGFNTSNGLKILW